MIEANSISELSKDKLLELLQIFGKNWLAHDGCWFLAIEQDRDMETAIQYDKESWRKFTVIEANRLKQFLELPDNSGITGLQKALSFRLYASINKGYCKASADELIYYVKDCRVQSARRKKGMPDFPCKSVGIIEYSLFASTIDSRFTTECLSCPPDVEDSEHACIWKFRLAK